MNNLPKVSVIIPAYNEERILGQTIQSILKQDYTNLEIVVIDDGSTDNTPLIVKRYVNQGIKYIRNETNRGLAYTLNRGFRSATGEVIGVLQADIILESPQVVGTLVNTLLSDEKIGAAVGAGFVREDFVSKLSRIEKVFIGQYQGGGGKPFKNTGLIEINFFGVKCDFFKRNVIEKVGFFDERFGRINSGEDMDLSIRIRKAGYKIVADTKAVFHHGLSSHQYGLRSHLRKAVNYAEADMLVLLKHHNFRESLRIPYIYSFILLLLSIVGYLYQSWELLASLLGMAFILSLLDKRMIRTIVLASVVGFLTTILLNPHFIYSTSIGDIFLIFLVGLLVRYFIPVVMGSISVARRFRDIWLLPLGVALGTLSFVVIVLASIKSLVVGLIDLAISAWRNSNLSERPVG